MSDILRLARPELREIRPYTPGAYEPGLVRLNANESPWRTPRDRTERGLNIYPPPRPDALRARLAEHYGVPADELLVTRGSSEAIDVLIRGFCRAGRDGIVVLQPTFDMYRLYATIQDAAVTAVPLIRDEGFAVDVRALLAQSSAAIKLVFLCSPNNPTGSSISRDTVELVCRSYLGRALVVIDEAYYEFADAPDLLDMREQYDHVVVLRTLSKCVSLAGARCGALIGDPRLVTFLGNVLPPYTFPTPSIELVLDALTEESLSVSRERISLVKRERRRMTDTLGNCPLVSRVFPSDANFVLIETPDAKAFADRVHRAGILVRTFPGQPDLANCVRITIGRPQDNDALIRAISSGDFGHAG